jgi:hypothetical protein
MDVGPEPIIGVHVTTIMNWDHQEYIIEKGILPLLRIYAAKSMGQLMVTIVFNSEIAAKCKYPLGMTTLSIGFTDWADFFAFTQQRLAQLMVTIVANSEIAAKCKYPLGMTTPSIGFTDWVDSKPRIVVRQASRW